VCILQWSWVRIFVFLGVNGSVVHGRGFESDFLGVNGGVVQWSWVRIFDFLGVNGGVVHDHGLWP
jgi:hypothetical protein